MGLFDFKDNALDLDQFKYHFDNGARPNRFEVDFHARKLGLSWEGLRVESCSLPGRSLEASDFSEYGQIRKMPFNVSDGGTVDFTFLCDSSFADRFLLEAWQSAIYSGKTGNLTEDGSEAGESGEDPDRNSQITLNESGTAAIPYFSYYNDYVGEVDIVQLRFNGESALRYRLFEAYPIAYAPMELSAQTRDDVMRFTVTMAYRFFSTEYVADRTAGGLLNKGRKILDIILDGAKLGSRFNSNAGKFYERLSNLDEKLSRLSSGNVG